MSRKKFLRYAPILASFLCLPPLYAQESISQTLQIYTHFKAVVGNPTWLLELRDMDSGQILPYLFEVKNNDNFWIAFSTEHSYQVKASTLKFGIYATIPNFCHLENGVLSGKSMYITLSGIISPDPRTSRCHVTKYNDTRFTVVGE